MSYCVHCGVELHETSKSCPLCNTPVVNPRIPLIPDGKKPFAEKKGQVDRVRHSDMAILLSVVLGSTGGLRIRDRSGQDFTSSDPD